MKNDDKIKTGFVGTQRISSADELKNLLLSKQLITAPNYYFLRWFHRVSGIIMKLPNEFPSPEGQMFNFERELRWKQRNNGYDLLLLSQVESDLNLGFQAIPNHWDKNHWEICDRDAHLYLTSQNQQPANFPKKFIFLDEHEKEIEKPDENIHIGQRYFKDSKTATVHFVALTINNKNDRNSSTQT